MLFNRSSISIADIQRVALLMTGMTSVYIFSSPELFGDLSLTIKRWTLLIRSSSRAMLLFQNLPTGTFVDIVIDVGEELLHLDSQVIFWGFSTVLTHFKPEKPIFPIIGTKICN